MRTSRNLTFCAGILAFLSLGGSGCGKVERGPLVVKGEISQATFASPPTWVRAVRNEQVRAETPVGVDGTFLLRIRKGDGYRLEFLTDSGAPVLVFPRRAGTLEARFDVKATASLFNLGHIRFIGDPSATGYAFVTAGADLDEVECEDGIDAKTGGVCVDDDDDEGATECEADEEHEFEGEEHGQNGTAVSLDPGSSGVQIPDQAAVAEHNLPAVVGCDAEEEEEEED